MTRTTLPFMTAAAALALAGLALAQAQPEDTRQIVAEEFVESRPAGAAKRPVPRARRAKPPGRPRVAELGVTIWRLRPAAAGEDPTRLLVQEGEGPAWMPERVDAGQKLALGDRVRLSFETPLSGYMYVLDREEYADGTFSDPYLIFPTERPVGSDHTVKPGRLVEIPSRDDRPNYFTVRQSRPDQVAEVLTTIVSEKPLPELPIVKGPTKLPSHLLAQWSAEWGAPTEKVVLPSGQSRSWSAAEAEAGSEPTRLLTQDDAPPQTIYRVQRRAGRPMLVHIRLPYGASSPRP